MLYNFDVPFFLLTSDVLCISILLFHDPVFFGGSVAFLDNLA